MRRHGLLLAFAAIATALLLVAATLSMRAPRPAPVKIDGIAETELYIMAGPAAECLFARVAMESGRTEHTPVLDGESAPICWAAGGAPDRSAQLRRQIVIDPRTDDLPALETLPASALTRL